MSKEKIEELAKFLWHNTNMYDEELIYDVAVSMHNAGYRKQREPISCSHEKGCEWISVEERLPRDTGEPEEYIVMLEHAHYPTVAMFYGGMFEKSALCKCTVLGSKVTHWMPLPEPPKGE